MTNYPLVSILIPTYNQAYCIEETVNSAMKQDYKNLEIIICDDSSNDGTEDKIQKLLVDSRVTYYRNPKNLGRVRNYRKGLYERARGEWVINLDGDDFFTNDKYISECVNLVCQNENVVLIQGGEIQRSDSGDKEKIPSIDEDSVVLDGMDYFLNFYRKYHFSHLASMYKRAEAIKCEFYQNNALSSDIESMLKLALSGRVILTKTIAGEWIIHNTNISSTATIIDLIDNLSFIDRLATYVQSRIEKDEIEKWKNNMRLLFFSHIVLNRMSGKKFFNKLIAVLPLSWMKPEIFFKNYTLKTILKNL